MRTPTTDDLLALRERPPGAPVMYQRWSRLLFLHWEWEAEAIARTLPEGLHVDRHQGRAFLGVVPFEMRRIRPRLLPPVPGISWFLELNLRTYVHDEAGRPGVWFYSLDANQRLAVALGRRWFGLPYFRASMRAGVSAGERWFDCERRGSELGVSSYRYRLPERPRRAEPGTLEFFLLERYLLFASTPRGLFGGRVWHEPYTFGAVEPEAWDGKVIELAGFGAPAGAPDHAVASPGVDVEVFALGARG